MSIKTFEEKYQERWENTYLTVKNASIYSALRQALNSSWYWLALLAELCLTTLAKFQKNFLWSPLTKSWISNCDHFVFWYLLFSWQFFIVCNKLGEHCLILWGRLAIRGVLLALNEGKNQLVKRALTLRRIQTHSFCMAFIVKLLKTGERKQWRTQQLQSNLEGAHTQIGVTLHQVQRSQIHWFSHYSQSSSKLSINIQHMVE